MARNRNLSGKPLVCLEAGKLLGMRQVAKVFAGRADGAARDPAGSAGGAADSREKISRLLSKIGDPEMTSRLLSKIGPGET